MSDWFENSAKRIAQRGGSVHVGSQAQFSRRRLIAGGSAAVGAAWTAPMLMASSAAAVGASACVEGEEICGSDPISAVCCPTGDCTLVGPITGLPVCENEVGGFCANSGSGRCRVSTVHCNGNVNTPDECNGCSTRPVCGGEGARCAEDDDCAQSPDTGFRQTCSNADAPDPTEFFCRLQCTDDMGCNVSQDQFCDSTTGFCAKHCDDDNDCQSPGTCLRPGEPNSICQYTQSTF